MAAVTQLRHTHSDGRAYFERKVAEGKTKRDALRSLKRHVGNAVYPLLADANRLGRNDVGAGRGRKKDGWGGKRTGNTGHFWSLQSPPVTQKISSEQGRKPLSRYNGSGCEWVRFPRLHFCASEQGSCGELTRDDSPVLHAR
jgi:hypothetical protein